MCLNWKCSADSIPKKNKVLIYDIQNKKIISADFVKAKNENYKDIFILDCGGTKQMHESVIFCEQPNIDEHVLKVYEKHFKNITT